MVRFLISLLAVLTVAPASAQWYPSRPVRLVIPFTAGGSQDVIARIFGQRVGDALGQHVVIDNRPGAGGVIGALEVARATPDGHTLLLSSGAQISLAPALGRRTGYDSLRDFRHVTHLVDLPMVLIVHPALPAQGVREFIAYSKANPGKVNAASTGLGTYTHLTIELFRQATGAEVTHVPYKGAAAAVNDLMGRQIQAMFTSTASAHPYTSTGRLRALAITLSRRSPTLPEVPTFAEAGVDGLLVSAWIGISAPSGIAPRVAERLAAEFGRALDGPEVRERLAALGGEPAGARLDAFTRVVRDDMQRWTKTVRTAGIKIE